MGFMARPSFLCATNDRENEDYLLKTRMANMNAYRAFAGTVLWQLPGVRETRTYAVMEEVKCTTRLALGV